MVDFNIISLKDELLNKFRSNFNAYDSKSRVTEATLTTSGDAVTKSFLISTKLSYIKTVTVDSISLSFGKDWSINWRGDDAGKITFVSAPSDNTDNIVIVYGYKSTLGNFVYPDFPRTDLGVSSLPRIGFKVTVNSDVGGFGNIIQMPYKHEILLQIKVVSDNTYEVDYLINKINDFLKKNCKNFYNFNFIMPQSIAEYDNFSDNTDRNYSKIVEYKIPFKYEMLTLS